MSKWRVWRRPKGNENEKEESKSESSKRKVTLESLVLPDTTQLQVNQKLTLAALWIFWTAMWMSGSSRGIPEP
ncbi:hypothetical protein IE53DRAFT_129167 [Violaceomyces palustris]|uniref:Uncharacterized protein n=1 Tax=Violaceomyces palustris TaxID=1673888 RepID=A0ACD0NVH4_9BASI|nr:hypothetical protein IE53DRAFT_129167 [Violaceomyces palustris]